LDWQHPALAQIFRLYLPIALGLVVSLVQVGIDRRLASGTGAQSIAWMANATTLQQMPLGLISVAIALASLPQLSHHFAAGDEAAFHATLGRGLRMVLLLIVPAAALLWVLGEPAVRLLFERNRFTPFDTAQVVAVLDIYLVGMLFAAVDYPLNFAFYARNNTWLPALVGVLSVGVYLVVALSLVGPLGFRGLVWADTAKHAGHALVMVVAVRTLARRQGEAIRGGPAWILVAGGVLAAVAGGIQVVLVALPGVAALPQVGRDLLVLAVAGGVGVTAYAGVLSWARVPELATVLARLRR
jgi:putative peptidoglycan lipid II flippase